MMKQHVEELEVALGFIVDNSAEVVEE